MKNARQAAETREAQGSRRYNVVFCELAQLMDLISGSVNILEAEASKASQWKAFSDESRGEATRGREPVCRVLVECDTRVQDVIYQCDNSATWLRLVDDKLPSPQESIQYLSVALKRHLRFASTAHVPASVYLGVVFG